MTFLILMWGHERQVHTCMHTRDPDGIRTLHTAHVRTHGIATVSPRDRTRLRRAVRFGINERLWPADCHLINTRISSLLYSFSSSRPLTNHACLTSLSGRCREFNTVRHNIGMPNRVAGAFTCIVPEDNAPPEVLQHGVQRDGGWAPLFANLSIRPVKAFVAFPNAHTVARRPVVYIPIWKVASTATVDALLAPLYNCSARMGNCFGPHSRTPSSSEEEVRLREADLELVARFNTGPHTGSSLIRRALAAGALVFTVARDPLMRFVSAFSPHGALPVCEWDGSKWQAQLGQSAQKKNASLRQSSLHNSSQPCPATLRALQAHAHNLAALTPHAFHGRVGWAHFVSQAYFLSATGPAGRRLRFDSIVRMEDYASGVQRVVHRLTGNEHAGGEYEVERIDTPTRAGGEDEVERTEAHTWRHTPRKNANHGGVVEMYARALLQTSERRTLCVLCALLNPDYNCLFGMHTLPAECASCRPTDAAPLPSECPRGSPYRCRFLDGTRPPADGSPSAAVWGCGMQEQPLTSCECLLPRDIMEPSPQIAEQLVLLDRVHNSAARPRLLYGTWLVGMRMPHGRDMSYIPPPWPGNASLIYRPLSIEKGSLAATKKNAARMQARARYRCDLLMRAAYRAWF